MNYKEVYDSYQEMKEALSLKKQALINRNLEEINRLDEQIKVICEKIARYDLKNQPNNFTQDEKEELKKLGVEIKKIQENNEILIKRSLDVINGILSGILDITQDDKCSYNSKGESTKDQQGFTISSITEEA